VVEYDPGPNYYESVHVNDTAFKEDLIHLVTVPVPAGKIPAAVSIFVAVLVAPPAANSIYTLQVEAVRYVGAGIAESGVTLAITTYPAAVRVHCTGKPCRPAAAFAVITVLAAALMIRRAAFPLRETATPIQAVLPSVRITFTATLTAFAVIKATVLS